MAAAVASCRHGKLPHRPAYQTLALFTPHVNCDMQKWKSFRAQLFRFLPSKKDPSFQRIRQPTKLIISGSCSVHSSCQLYHGLQRTCLNPQRKKIHKKIATYLEQLRLACSSDVIVVPLLTEEIKATQRKTAPDIIAGTQIQILHREMIFSVLLSI